jgi:acyl carrier protein
VRTSASLTPFRIRRSIRRQHPDTEILSDMSYSDQQIFDTLARFFAQEATGQGAIAVAPDTDIIGEGLVDSLAIFKLIAFVEETFGVTIAPDEVLLENFQTLRAVRNLIVKKLPA